MRTSEPQIPASIPEPFKHVITRCLSTDRSRRPTPTQMIELLGDRLTPQPSLGRDVLTVAAAGGDFTSVGEAVAAAAPWSRIVVRAGRYAGAIRLDKPIEIVGDGVPADVILDGGNRPAVVLTSGEAVIRSVSLRMSNPPARGVRAVVEVSGGHGIFDLCEVSSTEADCLYCVGKRSRPVFRRSRFLGGRLHGLVFEQDAEGLVDGCQVLRPPRAGIVISDRANPIVRHSSIVNPGYRGVMVSENGGGVVEDTEIAGGKGPAIELAKGSTTIFRRARIVAGDGPAVLASSGAKAVFVQCEPVAAKGREWELTPGHQVSRL